MDGIATTTALHQAFPARCDHHVEHSDDACRRTARADRAGAVAFVAKSMPAEYWWRRSGRLPVGCGTRPAAPGISGQSQEAPIRKHVGLSHRMAKPNGQCPRRRSLPIPSRRRDGPTHFRFACYSRRNIMDRRKIPNLVLALVVIASLLVGASGATSAAVPAPDVAVSAFEREATLQGEITAAASADGSATDETKIPHYFGPNPNWAISPFTLPDAIVTISRDGRGDRSPSGIRAIVRAMPLPRASTRVRREHPRRRCPPAHSPPLRPGRRRVRVATRSTPTCCGPIRSPANVYTVVFDSGPLNVLDCGGRAADIHPADPVCCSSG